MNAEIVLLPFHIGSEQQQQSITEDISSDLRYLVGINTNQCFDVDNIITIIPFDLQHVLSGTFSD